MKNRIQAGVFKTHCLQILNEIKKNGKEYIITKRGVPFAKIIPISNKKVSLFGKMKGTIDILGDIIKPISETWDADS